MTCNATCNCDKCQGGALCYLDEDHKDYGIDHKGACQLCGEKYVW